MPTYLLSSGEQIEYAVASPEVGVFVERARTMLASPAHTPLDLFLLVHGVENPLLDTASVPGRAVARKDALTNPVYHVLSDMVFRKQLAAAGRGSEEALAAYTLTVKEVAVKLGLTETAVRSARAAGKLAAAKRNGEWYFRPESVAAYKVSNRGRKKAAEEPEPRASTSQPHAVTVVCGSEPGGSLAVRLADAELVITYNDGNRTLAHFPDGWTRAAVKTTTANGVRVFELEPSPAQDADLPHEVRHLGFLVAGDFRVVRKHNSTRSATEAWKRYAPAAETVGGGPSEP